MLGDRYLDALALARALVLITVMLTVSEPWQERDSGLGAGAPFSSSSCEVRARARQAPLLAPPEYRRDLPDEDPERMSTAPKIWTATSLSPASQ